MQTKACGPLDALNKALCHEAEEARTRFGLLMLNDDRLSGQGAWVGSAPDRRTSYKKAGRI